MPALRITADVVRQLAKAADEAAKAKKAHYGSMYTRSDTDGTVYVAGHRQEVWRGRRGSQEAAAYYLGVVDALKDAPYLDLPGEHPNRPLRRATDSEHARVRDALYANFTGSVAREYGRGLDEGSSFKAHRR